MMKKLSPPRRALKALALLSIVVFTPIALTGCPNEVNPYASCSAEGLFNFKCSKVGVVFEWQFNRLSTGTPVTLNGAFDVSQASADFSQSSSSINVTANSGYATVKLTLSDSTVVVNAFPWVRQGDLIVAQNPSAVNNWVNSYLGDIVSADIDLGEITGTGNTGTNTLVTEAVYAGTVYGGNSYSWYSQPCDPSDPSGQCQIE